MNMSDIERREQLQRSSERALVAAVIHDPDARNNVATLVSAHDFRDPVLAEVFAFVMRGPKDPTLLQLHALQTSRSIDAKGRKKLSEASTPYHGPDLSPDALTALLEAFNGHMQYPCAVAACSTAKIVRELGVKRRMAELSQLQQQVERGEQVRMPDGTWVHGGMSMADTVAIFQEARLKISSELADDLWVDLSDAMGAAFDSIEAHERGEVCPLSTGLASLDALLDGGFRPGELVILSGRPSRGKTLSALCMIMHWASIEQAPGAFVSLEMSHIALASRFMAAGAGVNASKIRRASMDQDEWGRAIGFGEEVSSAWAKVRIRPPESLNHRDIRSLVRPLWANGELRYIVVDYLTLMKEEEGARSRTEGVGANATGLKRIAEHYGVPVICIAQMNRDYERRAKDKGPKFSNADLRDSGQIEQDADVIIFVDHDPTTGDGEYHVTKQRNGRLGVADVLFDLEQQRVMDAGDLIMRAEDRLAAAEAAKPKRHRLPAGYMWYDGNIMSLERNCIVYRSDIHSWWSEAPGDTHSGWGVKTRPGRWVRADCDPADTIGLFEDSVR